MAAVEEDTTEVTKDLRDRSRAKVDGVGREALWRIQVVRGVGVGTCSVVRDPRVDDADCLVWIGEVHLVRVGLEGLGQGPAETLLQTHLPLDHNPAGCLHTLLTGHVPMEETLLPRHPSLCSTGERIVWLHQRYINILSSHAPV